MRDTHQGPGEKYGKAPPSPHHLDRVSDRIMLAGLAGLVTSIGVYADSNNVGVILALASGAGAAAIIYLVAGPRRCHKG